MQTVTQGDQLIANGVGVFPGVSSASMPIDWRPAAFACSHRWDRNFYLTMVGLIWLGIGMGFGPEIVHRLATDARPFPVIVQVHAVAFVGWLCLLTAQVVLVRTRRTDLHMKLGVAGMVLSPAMVVLGIAAAVVVDRHHAGLPGGNAAFFSVSLADILNFAVMASAAFALRRRIPSAHKRLIILATIFITNAGFARWWEGPILHWVTRHHGVPGFWTYAAGVFLSDVLLILMMGVYDLITRRRLHPAFVLGASFGLLVEALAIGLYVSPGWKPVALRLIGL